MHGARPPADRTAIRRRRALAGVALLIVGVAAAWLLIAGGDSDPGGTAGGSSASGVATKSSKRKDAPPAANPQRITPMVAGQAKVITEGGPDGRKVALTFDDGFCPACVKRIIDVLERSGAHATLFPNGRYASSWEPQADRIRKMVAGGQVTLGNHTFSHEPATSIGPDAFAADLQRNEDWIEKTFGLTGRPWFRPPYGDYNEGTVAAAGSRGYTKVVMWSGTVADSSLRSPGYILNAIRHWARPGRIILMHGNYPTTAEVLPRILAMLREMKLTPVTMAELASGPTMAHSPSTGY